MPQRLTCGLWAVSSRRFVARVVCAGSAPPVPRRSHSWAQMFNRQQLFPGDEVRGKGAPFQKAQCETIFNVCLLCWLGCLLCFLCVVY